MTSARGGGGGEEVVMSRGAEAGTCRSVQKVTGLAWVRKGPRVGQCWWVLISNQATFLTHFPLLLFLPGDMAS